MRHGVVVILSFFLCSTAFAMASWIKCVTTATACMTMMDGSTGYCYEETCSAVLYAYTE